MPFSNLRIKIVDSKKGVPIRITDDAVSDTTMFNVVSIAGNHKKP
jgi:hypothetical protein